MPYEQNNALETDLYQVAMAEAYAIGGESGRTAVFELFVRNLPPHRNYLLAAGQELALEYLEGLHFTEGQIDYLAKHAQFQGTQHEGFRDMLRNFTFTGNVWAVPEGMPVFANEPIMTVSAPLAQANFVETYLLSVINSQTMWASKASRIADAAAPAVVTDFGTRRIDPDAAVKAARAAYIAGFIGTSNVEAGMRFGIPVFGTMAHSFVMSGDSMGPITELERFRKFAGVYPSHATLLIDTYKIEEGIHNALKVAKEMRARGIQLNGIRIDSGDIAFWSDYAHKMFKSEGLPIKVTASNDLDEYEITKLTQKGAKVDIYGVGTMFAMANSDAPKGTGGVYKVAEVEVNSVMQGRMKKSDEKSTYPWSKQVYYYLDAEGRRAYDEITLSSEERPDGIPLLRQVMRDGRRTAHATTIAESRSLADTEKGRLRASLRGIADAAEPQRVVVSDRLQGAQAEAVRSIMDETLSNGRNANNKRTKTS